MCVPILPEPSDVAGPASQPWTPITSLPIVTYRGDMRPALVDDEPTFADWMAVDPNTLLRKLGLTRSDRQVLAVDGRSAGGKSTLAQALCRAAGDAVVVHTDDVAWHLSMFDWDTELVSGILDPWRAGGAVDYRPPGWITQQRPGSITIPASARLLIVEGVGSSRARLVEHLDAAIWVHSDADQARTRGIERDLACGVNGATWELAAGFFDQWLASEHPFLAADRPWGRADAVIAGMPVIDLASSQLAVSRTAEFRCAR